jgi:hypothetical protein
VRVFYIWTEIKTPTMDKLTNLKGMVSRYKNPTMDKHTDLKGMVSRNKNPHNGQIISGYHSF